MHKGSLLRRCSCVLQTLGCTILATIVGASGSCCAHTSRVLTCMCSCRQVTAYMEHLTSDLESAAHPALDAIIGKARAQHCSCDPGHLLTM